MSELQSALHEARKALLRLSNVSNQYGALESELGNYESADVHKAESSAASKYALKLKRRLDTMPSGPLPGQMSMHLGGAVSARFASNGHGPAASPQHTDDGADGALEGDEGDDDTSAARDSSINNAIGRNG